MTCEVQLISDGDGLAVIGEPSAVDLFLDSEGLKSKALDLPRLSTVLASGGATAQVSSDIAANSGSWVKLTKESSEAVKKYGLRTNAKTGRSTGVVKGEKGQIKSFVEFAKGPGTALGNPAVLAGVAGMMAQLAMRQTMDEITDYLVTIDEKLDDVLRAQVNQVLARMDGADLAIREAMTVRDSVGHVSEVTWSKVQATSSTVLETQAFALRQLRDLAEKLERTTKVDDLTKATKDAQAEVLKWLKVLARCFQLQDAAADLELDRVLDAAPDELDRHRLGLMAARQDRLELISTCTERLIRRMDTAAGAANRKVLTNPFESPALVAASNEVAGSVVDFNSLLGIHREREALEARRWKAAASEVKVKAMEKGSDRFDAAKRTGSQTFGKAKSVTGRASTRISERARRWRQSDASENDSE